MTQQEILCHVLSEPLNEMTLSAASNQSFQVYAFLVSHISFALHSWHFCLI